MKKLIAFLTALLLVLPISMFQVFAASNYVWNTNFTNPYGTAGDQVKIHANPGARDSNCEPETKADWHMVSRADWANYAANHAGCTIEKTDNGVVITQKDYSAIDPNNGNQCATVVACWMTSVPLDGASIAIKDFNYNKSGAVGDPSFNFEYNIEPRFNHGTHFMALGIRIHYVVKSGNVYVYLTSPERNEFTGNSSRTGYYSYNSNKFKASDCTVASENIGSNLTDLSSKVVGVKSGNAIVAYKVYINDVLLVTLCKDAATANAQEKGKVAEDLFLMMEDDAVGGKVFVMAGMYDHTYWKNNPYYQTNGVWDPEKGKQRVNLCSFRIVELNGKSLVPNVNAPVRYKAVQESAVVDNKFNIRLVATVDELNYQEVGFDVVAHYTENGTPATKEFKRSCNYVYNKLVGRLDSGIVREYTADELGGNYLMALSILDIPADIGTITFVVKPYCVKDGVKTYGDTYNIVYVNGKFNSVNIG